jgi:hypothetical protein
MYRRIALAVAALAILAAAVSFAPESIPRASAGAISCAAVDRTPPLRSADPNVTIVSYTLVRYVDTDFVRNCNRPVDATYALNLVIRDLAVSELKEVDVDCKVIGADGLLRGHVNFTLAYPSMEPGDASQSGDSEGADYQPGDHLNCSVTSAK